MADLCHRKISVGASARGRDRCCRCASGQALADRREVRALSHGKNRFVPEVLVAGGAGGALEGLAAALIGEIRGKVKPAEAAIVTK